MQSVQLVYLSVLGILVVGVIKHFKSLNQSQFSLVGEVGAVSVVTVTIDCKTVGFFLKISKETHSLFSASFQTFCLTACVYMNMQKYGLFCSLL